MKFFSAAALLTAIASTANALLVNTPVNVVQCQPVLITWDPQGSAGPFFLSVHPGDNPTGPAIISWDNLSGTSQTWTVTVASGTSLGLLLRDATGATSQSAAFTVQPGSATDCSGTSSSVSLAPGSSLSSVPASSVSSIPASPTPTPTPVTTPVSTSTRPPSSVSTPTSVRSSTTSSPASTATGGSSSGGALSNAVNFGSAGFLAALVGAVLA